MLRKLYLQQPHQQAQLLTANCYFSSLATSTQNRTVFELVVESHPIPPVQVFVQGLNLGTMQHDGMSTFSAVDEKPFPFLRLPAELRNRIYKYAIAETDDALHLYHVLPCYHQKGNRSWIGMNTVCRQIRAEFRPLFYHDVEIVVRLCDLPSFLRTFFSATVHGDTSITKVTVTAYDNDVSGAKEWDILPLLQTKAFNGGHQWSFEAFPSQFRYHFRVFWPTGDIGAEQVSSILNRIVNFPARRFLGDIRSGLFSDIRLCQGKSRAPYEWCWVLVVRKKKGKLNQQEKNSMERYCKELAVFRRVLMTPWSWRTNINEDAWIEDIVRVKILVRNARARLVEMYIWNATKSRLDMIDGVTEKSITQNGRAGRLRW